MKIVYSEINNIDLSALVTLITRLDHRGLLLAPAGDEHYKLLGYISLNLNNAKIVELGTHNGTSSTALSINISNHVRTYDIRDMYSVREQPNNVTRVIGNIFDLNEQHHLLEADFIFLDTAHTGDFEMQVYEYLRDNKYNGFIIFDDILWSDEMINFWDKIPNDIKYDITSIGHGKGLGPRGNVSGTGLVDFSGNIELIRNI